MSPPTHLRDGMLCFVQKSNIMYQFLPEKIVT